MSGVPQRKRSISTQEFFNTAIKINSDIMALMVREDVVPKRYRFLIGVPTAQTAREILVEINRADSFYPNSAANVLKRREHYNLAIAACEQLYMDVQAIIGNDKLPARASKFEEIAEKITLEIKLLKGVRDNTKPPKMSERTYDEWVEEAEDELRRRIALRDEEEMRQSRGWDV